MFSQPVDQSYLVQVICCVRWKLPTHLCRAGREFPLSSHICFTCWIYSLVCGRSWCLRARMFTPLCYLLRISTHLFLKGNDVYPPQLPVAPRSTHGTQLWRARMFIPLCYLLRLLNLLTYLCRAPLTSVESAHLFVQRDGIAPLTSVESAHSETFVQRWYWPSHICWICICPLSCDYLDVPAGSTSIESRGQFYLLQKPISSARLLITTSTLSWS